MCIRDRDDEGVVQRAPAHVGERGDFDRAALEQLADPLETHQVVERVVQWSQIGIDLLCQVTGQEAQALAGLDGGAGEDDALHQFALEGIHRRSDRQVGLAGPRRAGAERDVVLLDVCLLYTSRCV